MTAAIASALRLVLDVHICDQRRTIQVTFATDAAAVDYIARKSSTCAFWIANEEELEGDAIAAAFPLTLEALFPICEHGLSLQLCSGPNHFGERHDEWAN